MQPSSPSHDWTWCPGWGWGFHIAKLKILSSYFCVQIGVNPMNPLIVGSILVVDTFAASFMPAYLILEAARVGHFQDFPEDDKAADSTMTNLPHHDAAPMTA
jgi:hypothetical protein